MDRSTRLVVANQITTQADIIKNESLAVASMLYLVSAAVLSDAEDSMLDALREWRGEFKDLLVNRSKESVADNLMEIMPTSDTNH